MRRLLLLAAAGGLVWWLRARGRREDVERATIGYEDGSSITLALGSPDLERLLEAARGAFRR